MRLSVTSCELAPTPRSTKPETNESSAITVIILDVVSEKSLRSISWGQKLRKWKAVFHVYFQEGIAYRASGLIWILMDLTTAITMPLVWSQASALNQGPIQGFAQGDFVLYYLCFLLLGSFITCHMMWEIGMEVKEGQFTTMLLRPINFLQYTFFRNLAWRVIRISLFFPFFLILMFSYQSLVGSSELKFSWEFVLTFFLGHCVSFFFVTALAMTALFVEEAQSVFELYYVPAMFLSGQLFPIGVLPDWAGNLAKALPFYYTAGLPTEILIGRVSSAKAHEGIVIQVVYIVASIFAWRLLWKSGLKRYTGVGM